MPHVNIRSDSEMSGGTYYSCENDSGLASNDHNHSPTSSQLTDKTVTMLAEQRHEHIYDRPCSSLGRHVSFAKEVESHRYQRAHSEPPHYDATVAIECDRSGGESSEQDDEEIYGAYNASNQSDSSRSTGESFASHSYMLPPMAASSNSAELAGGTYTRQLSPTPSNEHIYTPPLPPHTQHDGAQTEALSMSDISAMCGCTDLFTFLTGQQRKKQLRLLRHCIAFQCFVASDSVWLWLMIIEETWQAHIQEDNHWVTVLTCLYLWMFAFPTWLLAAVVQYWTWEVPLGEKHDQRKPLIVPITRLYAIRNAITSVCAFFGIFIQLYTHFPYWKLLVWLFSCPYFLLGVYIAWHAYQ